MQSCRKMTEYTDPSSTAPPAPAGRDSIRRRILEEEPKFLTLFEHGTDGLMLADPGTHRLVLVNPSLLHMLGYPNGEQPDLRIEDIIPPDVQHRTLHLFMQPGCGGEDRSCPDGKLLRKDGGILRTGISAFDCTVVGQRYWMGLFREQPRMEGNAEAKPSELKEQLDLIYATVPGMIYSFQMNPDGTTCMPYCNARITELFGLGPEDVVDDFSPALARIHPADISYVWESITQSARTLKLWRNEFRVRHPEKGEIWIDGISMPRRRPDGSVR